MARWRCLLVWKPWLTIIYCLSCLMAASQRVTKWKDPQRNIERGTVRNCFKEDIPATLAAQLRISPGFLACRPVSDHWVMLWKVCKALTSHIPKGSLLFECTLIHGCCLTAWICHPVCQVSFIHTDSPIYFTEWYLSEWGPLSGSTDCRYKF